MGQITTAELGVSVSLPLTFENIKLILRLLEMRMDIRVLRTYVSGMNENEDEIKDYENDDFEVDMIDEFDEDGNLVPFADGSTYGSFIVDSRG